MSEGHRTHLGTSEDSATPSALAARLIACDIPLKFPPPSPSNQFLDSSYEPLFLSSNFFKLNTSEGNFQIGNHFHFG